MSADREALREMLREAANLVEAADVPDDLRAAAFTEAVRLLSGQPAGPEGASDQPQLVPQASQTSLLAKVARRLGVDEAILTYFYEEDQGDLRLVVRRQMLPNSNSRAAAMRAVGLLVLAGRQAAELEEWTSYDVIRAECDELNVLDRPNFATELQSLEMRTRPIGRTKEAKLSRHGFDRATQLIQSMAQGLA